MSGNELGCGGLRAGAARVEITPERGIHLGGNQCRLRPRDRVQDPLYARALLLELSPGEQRIGAQLCLLSLDTVYVTNEWVHEIRRQAQSRFGLAPDSVMVHATQTHAAPNIGRTALIREDNPDLPREYEWLRGGDDRYIPFALERILAAIGKAQQGLAPVTLAAGGQADGRAAFNRRFIMRDGSVRVHPRPDELPNILQVEGPTDPEVGVLAFRGEDGRTVAAILHHTCHPCHGLVVKGLVSAGWPGAWADQMEAILGEPCQALVANGCCGNIHHRNHLDPHWREGDTPQRVAGWLSESGSQVIDSLRFEEASALDCKSSIVRIPYQPPDPQDVEWAGRMLRDHPTPIWVDQGEGIAEWDWVYAVAVRDFDRRVREQPWYDYEIQVFRIGDCALVGLIGEPFVEGQLEIKLASPAKRTFVAHMCNGWAGYIPTYAAYQRGGLSTNDDGRPVRRGANWFRLAPQALSMIVEAASEILGGMFGRA